MGNFIAVALGGACGAAGRYALSLLPFRAAFPLATLLANLLGAALIGFITGLSVRRQLPAWRVLFWKTGVCGGFTTFSTFSLETLGLFEQGRTAIAALYLVLSVGLCLLGVALGRMAAALS